MDSNEKEFDRLALQSIERALAAAGNTLCLVWHYATIERAQIAIVIGRELCFFFGFVYDVARLVDVCLLVSPNLVVS